MPTFQTPHGVVRVAKTAQIADEMEFQHALASQRKDVRFYRLMEETLIQGFDYFWFALESPQWGKAYVPFFTLDQDLLQGSGKRVQSMVGAIRKIWRRFLTMRTVMIGCAAAEGHLDDGSDERKAWMAQCIETMVRPCSKHVKCGMIVWKEFPAKYRKPLASLRSHGFTRVPSLPMTRLNIDYPSFDEYLQTALSKATRKSLRRKFRTVEDATRDHPIECEVLQDITPLVDQVHPLYMQVYNRSNLHFEKLTPEFLSRLGRELPEKVRFFVWRQRGKIIAFSVTMIQGDELYDEYLGMDYSIALDLHLYFVTLRDIINWAIAHNIKWYCSSALNYDPKLHLRSRLYPLDLYVTHTNRIVNFFLARFLPLLEPTRNDKTLAQFSNHAELWEGDEAMVS